MGKEDILRLLEERQIPYKIAEHEAIYTMAESDALTGTRSPKISLSATIKRSAISC